MGASGETLTSGNEALYEAAFRTGDYRDAEATFTGLLERARETGDRALEAAALDRLGMLGHFRALERDLADADTEAEERLFRQALDIRRELGDPAGTAESLFGLGLVHQVLRGDWETAMPYFREALELAEKHGDLLLRSEVHRHIGFYYTVGDLQSDLALHHLRISHELRAELGDPRWIPGGTVALGLAEIADGLREQGLAHVRRALEEARDAGLSPQRVEWIEKLAGDLR
ncbi:tetratricopeptide repeat protein [Pseudosporangium ferrugineum]|uniref:Tetratricopeptide repeat protein n=1 Tax=Pseudosporangium ferrugineum TaxID=439699 RepID=A0A2T0RNT2_9ACTN|nr:tetratricopeptide repeat protein [Pseudosporangium ferrugineum]PRY22866.1 tetratricopeptide repeat protein [Pseudosporangium ferrugineum]